MRATDAIMDLLLADDRLDVNLHVRHARHSGSPLHAVAMRGPSGRLRRWLQDPRFDVHLRDSPDHSILDVAVNMSSSEDHVRAILEDGRVKPTTETICPVRHFSGGFGLGMGF